MENLTYAIVDTVDVALTLLTWAIIIRAVLSWIRPNPSHPAVRFLNRITDPILQPIQSIIPNFSGLDLSPIVAILLIQVVQNLLLKMLL